MFPSPHETCLLDATPRLGACPGIGLGDLLERKRPAWGLVPLKHVADYAGDVGEAQLALQESGYRDFVGAAEHGGVGASGLPGFPR